MSDNFWKEYNEAPSDDHKLDVIYGHLWDARMHGDYEYIDGKIGELLALENVPCVILIAFLTISVVGHYSYRDDLIKRAKQTCSKKSLIGLI